MEIIIISLLIGLAFGFYKILQLNKKLTILNNENAELVKNFEQEKTKLIESFKNSTLEELNTFIQQKNEIARNAIEEQEKLVNQVLADKQRECEEMLAEYERCKKEKATDIYNYYTRWLQEIEDQVAAMKSTADSAIEIAKASFEDTEQLRLHMLLFSDDELAAIKQLNKVASEFPLVRAEILNVIYNTFYSGKIRELGKRLTNGQKLCGIYKITNVKTQQCYIGQSVDIAARWVTHIKRAVGIETETQNKLYPAMRREGIENFSFQVVEEVPKDKLRERELYWQDFYNARNWGYSVK